MPRKPVMCKCGSCEILGYVVQVNFIKATVKYEQRAYRCQVPDFKRFGKIEFLKFWTDEFPENKSIFLSHLLQLVEDAINADDAKLK